MPFLFEKVSTFRIAANSMRAVFSNNFKNCSNYINLGPNLRIPNTYAKRYVC